MPHDYKNPNDIKGYGIMVHRFASSAKYLARGMTALGMPVEDIQTVVGKGRYNTLEAQGYIIYGPEKTAAAKKNMEGLFGAFYYVHRPELQMSQQAPVLLGKAGCKLVAVRENGEKALFPLERVGFDFLPRSGGERGKITLRSDVEAVQADSRLATLKSGTVLTDGQLWKKNHGKPQFDIVDAQGKSLEENAATLMLWGHLGSMGFKALGQGTAEFRTIELDGTDDDFTAEGYMVQWLRSVKAENGIDLMPEFNKFVASARESLMAKPELLASFSNARELSELARYASDSLIIKPYSHPLDYAVLNLAGVGSDIANTASMLDLALPPATIHDTALKADFQNKLNIAVKTVNGEKKAKINQVLEYELKAFIDQNQDPFSPAWIEGKGNTLKNPDQLPLKQSRMLQFLEGEGKNKRLVTELTADALEAAVRPAVVRKLNKMSKILDQVRSAANNTNMNNNPVLSAPEMRNEFNTSLTEARLAIQNISQAVQNPAVPVKDLSQNVQTIRKACEQINRLYGSAPELKTASPAHKPAFASTYLARHITDALVQMRHQAQGDHAATLASRVSRHDTQKYWQEKRVGNFERFLNLMDAVDADPKKWMSLYRDTSALINLEAAERKGFAEVVAAQKTGTAQVAAR